MANKSNRTFQIGRNAKTGELATVAKAKANPSKYIVESMPKPGHGDVNPSNNNKKK